MTKVYFRGEPLFVKTIKDLKPGESAYCVPWAYNPHTNEIDESFSVSDTSGGTVEMKVYRDVEGDLEIDLRNVSYEYQRESKK